MLTGNDFPKNESIDMLTVNKVNSFSSYCNLPAVKTPLN